MKLAGKVAVIIGASSGIGAATATLLARAGVQVTLSARRADVLNRIASELEAAGGRAIAVACDVHAEESVRQLFDRSDAHWRRLDIIVNCAAVGIDASIHDGPVAAWDQMWDTNVRGVALAMREALKRFDPQVGGHVVNVSSTSAHRILPGAGFYAATKYAMAAITEIARQELAERASPSRISSVSPGRVKTALFSSPGEKAASAADPDIAAILSAEDVAQTILQVLATPANVAIQDVIIRAKGQGP